MGDLERILPSELRGATLVSGNELVLPYAEALDVIIFCDQTSNCGSRSGGI
jgi:hypothetical protein